MAKRSGIDFTKPIETKCGYDIKIYEIVYPKYMNGAFYDRDTDIWWARQWDMDGKDSAGEHNLNLRNVNVTTCES